MREKAEADTQRDIEALKEKEDGWVKKTLEVRVYKDRMRSLEDDVARLQEEIEIKQRNADKQIEKITSENDTLTSEVEDYEQKITQLRKEL